MRVLLIPLIIMSAVAGELSEEPSEAQMRGAFEQSLAAQVRNALVFAAESAGPQAVLAIQESGTDRFEIQAFEKRVCARLSGQGSFRCEFAVSIFVVNGSLHGGLAGRFTASPRGFIFEQEDPAVPLTEVSSIL